MSSVATGTRGMGPPGTRGRQSLAMIGVSGATRNPAAALAVDGRLVAFCEQQRLTRVRSGAATEFPHEAMTAVLGLGGIAADDVAGFAVAEAGIPVPPRPRNQRFGHHHAHAATAFLTSPFARAAVIVSDGDRTQQRVSAWLGAGTELTELPIQINGPDLAQMMTEATRLFGYGPGQQHRFESLARLSPQGDSSGKLDGIVTFAAGVLSVDPAWSRRLADWLFQHGDTWPIAHGARVAGSFQSALGAALVSLAAETRARTGATALCLGGGLFYNTFFTTVLARSGLFGDVHVAANPGNSGIAAGAALSSCGIRPDPLCAVPPFLGPAFDREDIKRVLDNCKLSYEYLPHGSVIDRVVDDLMAGRLVAWFQGRMEWGVRALGNRSILASPLSPYVLDNLNVFLKQREPYRTYGVSVPAADAARYFDGPPRSPSMAFDYTVKERELFRAMLPDSTSTLRVHTVDDESDHFSELLRAFGTASGVPVLVNTSFNAFSEPIVCTPRQAVHAFYSTGLDVLVMDRFVLRK